MLAFHFLAQLAVPDGGGVSDALTFLGSKDKLVGGLKNAKSLANEAIQAIRESKEPNPYKEATDEEIAYEILKRIPNMCEDCGKTKYKINDQMVCLSCFNGGKVK